MAKRMLIDAAHPEETRVVVTSGTRLEEFDFESSTKKQVKGNIYLAKVTRVEPSLQATFVDYGGNRHGFLAFSEIHPDYYRIPVSDRPPGEAAPQAGEPITEDDGDNGVALAAALPEPVSVLQGAAAEDERAGDPDGADEPEWGSDFEIEESDRSPGHPFAADRVEAAPLEDLRLAAEPPEPAQPADAGERLFTPAGEAADQHDDIREWAGMPATPTDHSEALNREPESRALRVAEGSLLAAEVGTLAKGTPAVNGEIEAESVETFGGDEVEEVEEADAERRRTQPTRHYKIQEVIKRRQIMLVQVVKEERGNKGAALTTYLSLAGRYCVLMPNTAARRRRLAQDHQHRRPPAAEGDPRRPRHPGRHGGDRAHRRRQPLQARDQARLRIPDAAVGRHPRATR